MPGSNKQARATARMVTDFTFYSNIHASAEDALSDDTVGIIDLTSNVSGDQNVIYGIAVHNITTANSIYDNADDSATTKAALYMRVELGTITETNTGTPEDPVITKTFSTKPVWLPVGEPKTLVGGQIFKFDNLYGTHYKLAIYDSAASSDLNINISYQYEPMNIATSDMKYLFPPHSYNSIPEDAYNSANNISDYNTNTPNTTVK